MEEIIFNNLLTKFPNNTNDFEQIKLGYDIESKYLKFDSEEEKLQILDLVINHLNNNPIYYSYIKDLEKSYNFTKDLVIFITGGTEGLGLSTANYFKEKAKVVVTGRDKSKFIEMDKKIECIEVDVTDYDKSKIAINNIVDKYKRIDVLINNAGILYDGEIFDHSKEQISKLIDINVKGVEYMCSIVSPYMITQNQGLIINVVSQSGLYHRRNRSLYNSSKWAITGFTKCLASDLAKFNIRVSGLYPGKINTNIFANTNVDPKERSLNSSEVVKSIEFIINNNSVLIPELGIKAITQQSMDEICY